MEGIEIYQHASVENGDDADYYEIAFLTRDDLVNVFYLLDNYLLADNRRLYGLRDKLYPFSSVDNLKPA